MAKRLWGKLFGDKGYLSSKLSELLGEAECAADYKVEKEYEEQIDAIIWQIIIAKASDHWNGQWPIKEHLASRTHSPSVGLELLWQCRGRLDRLHISRKKTKSSFEKRFGSKLILMSNWR